MELRLPQTPQNKDHLSEVPTYIFQALASLTMNKHRTLAEVLSVTAPQRSDGQVFRRLRTADVTQGILGTQS